MLDVNVKNKARRSMNATSYHLQQKKTQNPHHQHLQKKTSQKGALVKVTWINICEALSRTLFRRSNHEILLSRLVEAAFLRLHHQLDGGGRYNGGFNRGREICEGGKLIFSHKVGINGVISPLYKWPYTCVTGVMP